MRTEGTTDRPAEGRTDVTKPAVAFRISPKNVWSCISTRPLCLSCHAQRYLFSHQSFFAITHLFNSAKASLKQFWSWSLLEWYMSIMILTSSAKIFQLWTDSWRKSFMYICMSYQYNLQSQTIIAVNLYWIKFMLSVITLGPRNNSVTVQCSNRPCFVFNCSSDWQRLANMKHDLVNNGTCHTLDKTREDLLRLSWLIQLGRWPFCYQISRLSYCSALIWSDLTCFLCLHP